MTGPARTLALLVVALALPACAENLNPVQKRAWDAFKDCQSLAPTATLREVTTTGGLGFEARGGDYQIMLKCLNERHGYSFR